MKHDKRGIIDIILLITCIIIISMLVFLLKRV